MLGRWLPLFPLNAALLPYARLPLHIFEERYREMIIACLSEEREFGVVLQREDGILRTGCTAEIEKVSRRYDDGRLDIVAVGRRRFQIVELDQTRSFLQAEVEYLEDPEFVEPSPESVGKAMACFLALRGPEPDESPALNDPALSFRLAAASDDMDFRQTVLSTMSEAERMESVAEHLAWLIYKKKTRERMQRVLRTNGHGKHVAGFGGEA